VKGFPITDDINGCRAGDDGVENPATGFREKANRYSRFVSGCAPFRNPVAAGVDMEVVLPYCLLKIPAKIEEYVEFLPSYLLKPPPPRVPPATASMRGMRRIAGRRRIKNYRRGNI
jgi:hypothetical protein